MAALQRRGENSPKLLAVIFRFQQCRLSLMPEFIFCRYEALRRTDKGKTGKLRSGR